MKKAIARFLVLSRDTWHPQIYSSTGETAHINQSSKAAPHSYSTSKWKTLWKTLLVEIWAQQAPFRKCEATVLDCKTRYCRRSEYKVHCALPVTLEKKQHLLSTANVMIPVAENRRRYLSRVRALSAVSFYGPGVCVCVTSLDGDHGWHVNTTIWLCRTWSVWTNSITLIDAHFLADWTMSCSGFQRCDPSQKVLPMKKGRIHCVYQQQRRNQNHRCCLLSPKSRGIPDAPSFVWATSSDNKCDSFPIPKQSICTVFAKERNCCLICLAEINVASGESGFYSRAVQLRRIPPRYGRNFHFCFFLQCQSYIHTTTQLSLCRQAVKTCFPCPKPFLQNPVLRDRPSVYGSPWNQLWNCVDLLLAWTGCFPCSKFLVAYWRTLDVGESSNFHTGIYRYVGHNSARITQFYISYLTNTQSVRQPPGSHKRKFCGVFQGGAQF